MTIRIETLRQFVQQTVGITLVLDNCIGEKEKGLDGIVH